MDFRGISHGGVAFQDFNTGLHRLAGALTDSIPTMGMVWVDRCSTLNPSARPPCHPNFPIQSMTRRPKISRHTIVGRIDRIEPVLRNSQGTSQALPACRDPSIVPGPGFFRHSRESRLTPDKTARVPPRHGSRPSAPAPPATCRRPGAGSGRCRAACGRAGSRSPSGCRRRSRSAAGGPRSR